LEFEVLTALWSAGRPLVPGEVLAVLGGDLAYTSVMTILVRLHEKGVVERSRVGRAYAYRPVVEESELISREVRHLLDRGSDRRSVLQGFLDGLTPEDAAALRDLLAAHGDAGEAR
jgi:predicted transcriptional regulator